jgi:FMN phosphatase YigB (HAD superfamily)
MGAGASKTTRGLVVSLDALGTLYKFREPVAVQYSKIARQCGFKGEYDIAQLEKSFKSAFKTQNKLFPNYGGGQLPHPQVWWEDLVDRTFGPFTTLSTPLPAETGRRLYEHFTSGNAYELFPDVQPFLETMSKLKNDFSDPDGSIVLTGIITNSDPRVHNVLNSLGLRVNVSRPARTDIQSSMKVAWDQAKDMRIVTPINHMYNSGDHFNFILTSCEVGSEKPDPAIFARGENLARVLSLSRLFQENEKPETAREAWAVLAKTLRSRKDHSSYKWIHIGDDYEKDYEGAKDYGFEALLLDRDGSHTGKENVVSSLQEAGLVINIMAQDLLRSQ